MELLSSHWVIGAGGGLVCGLIVTWVVRHLFSGREHREYHHKVAAANREIIQAIRPAIAEKIIPSAAMLDALFSATARKYGIHSGDLLPRIGFANELIKDIVDNPFLSSQQKVDYCELLTAMKHPEGEPSSRRVVEVITIHRRGDATDPSALLGLTAGLTAFVMISFFHLRDRVDFLASGQLLKMLPLMAIISIIPIIAFLVYDLLRQMSRPRVEVEEEKVGTTPPVASAPAGHRELTLLESKPAQSAS